MATGLILNKNQSGVYWIKLVLSKYAPSLTGMLFSSIICYSMVQHSMGITLCGVTLFEDVFRPLVSCVNLSERSGKRIKQAIGLVLSALSILYAISFQFVKSTMLSMFFMFNNTMNSPMLGLYLLSAFNPYANAFGAITGFLINLAINYWLGAGSLFFSKLVSEEYPAYTSLCNLNANKTLDFERFNFNSSISYFLYNSKMLSNASCFYYPENKVIYYFYSIASIWYCVWSVMLTFVLGSLFSLAYSLIWTRSLDADDGRKEERKEYLFFTRTRGICGVFKAESESIEMTHL